MRVPRPSWPGIGRHPCLQRGGLCPHGAAGGLGRREKHQTRRGGGEERRRGFSPCGLAAAAAGPAPRLPPRSARTVKRCPFRGRDGLQRLGCPVVRGETSPFLATLPQGTMASVGRKDPERR